jgi:type IV secretion system protein VirD4
VHSQPPPIQQKKYGLAVEYRVIGFFAAILAALIASTQTFAWQFSWQRSLGGNLCYIYPPWKILSWYSQVGNQFQDQFSLAFGIGALVFILGLILLFAAITISRNTAKASEILHGSAKWAEEKEIKAAGLLSKDGVYVGSWIDKKGRQRYLRHDGPEHVFTYAPTRSGKGVGLVIPTLLTWEQSVVVTDLKGELWAITAGWRKRHANQKVLLFDPASMSGSAAWNPLEDVRIGTENETGDIQNLTALIMDPDGKGMEDHWAETADSMLVGVIIHVLYKAKNGDGPPASLPAVDAALSEPNRPIGELWKEMLEYKHIQSGVPHSLAAKVARDMIDRPEKEAASIISTAKRKLRLYRDPIVARNISRSDFHIKDLMNHEIPVSLYIVANPANKDRLRPLVRILLSMIVRHNAGKIDFEKGRPKPHYKHKLLMMIDEFPSFGKLAILEESLAFVAGYGIKMYLIAQDTAQLHAAYGQNESITSNCHVQNAFAPNKLETAEHISKLTGVTTVVKEQVTVSGSRTGLFQGQVSKNLQEVRRALLTTDEVLRLPGPQKTEDGLSIKVAGDMVIYVAGFSAIYGKQILYYQVPFFIQRSEVEGVKESDVIVLAQTEFEKVVL